MNETLTKLIKNNETGLFLLDPPTGFGKTTEVVDLISRFLKGDSAFSKVKRIFFVTNLLGNLPYENLKEKLNDEERQQLFWAKATNEDVIDNILKVNIINKEILSSFVINILKRTDAKPKINISENVIQIPYLFDPETGLINDEAIDYIGELYC